MLVQLDLAQMPRYLMPLSWRVGLRTDPAPITQSGRDVPYFILADDAFALKTWLMKPYGRKMLTREERIASYRISRGRRVVENAFGILVSRFRVMRTTIELPPETVREVVFTCVVLHNILRSQFQPWSSCTNTHWATTNSMMMCLVIIDWLVVLLVVVQTETLLEKPKDRGITSRTTSIMREQWPGKMAEYNSCCRNQSFSGLITSPFKD